VGVDRVPDQAVPYGVVMQRSRRPGGA